MWKPRAFLQSRDSIYRFLSIQRPNHSSLDRIFPSVFHPHFWQQPERLRNRLYSWHGVQASVGLLGWRGAWGNLCRYECTSEVTDDGAWARLRLAAEFGWTKGNSSSPRKIKKFYILYDHSSGKPFRSIAVTLHCFEECSVSTEFPQIYDWLSNLIFVGKSVQSFYEVKSSSQKQNWITSWFGSCDFFPRFSQISCL